VSIDTDPYIADHVFGTAPLMPAVIGLEAMAQAAMAVLAADTPPAFEQVRFDQAIVVSDRAPIVLRIAAFVAAPGVVELAIRSSTTGFHVDHFRATCRATGPGALGPADNGHPLDPLGNDSDRVAVDPDRDLYGRLLFQQRRFKRVRRYNRLRATECEAEVAAECADPWFVPYLDPTLVLGDPGVRDAALHAIQPCIPHVALLPVGIDRLVPAIVADRRPWTVSARERSRDGDTFTYDVELRSSDGCQRERWEGLRLRAAGPTTVATAWSGPLLGPYIERRVRDLIPDADIQALVACTSGKRAANRIERLVRQLLGHDTVVSHRPDGKPELPRMPDTQVSVAGTGELELIVTATASLGCDVEPVVARAENRWRALLGSERYALAASLHGNLRDSLDACATRVWTVMEALTKAGAPVDERLVLSRVEGDGWILLRAGAFRAASYAAAFAPPQPSVAVAVVVREAYARI
jgi:enediyne polyketide synthase